MFSFLFQKNDLVKKAAEEGTVAVITKSTCVCKKCGQPGHNSRTCGSRNDHGEQDQQTIPDIMQQQQGRQTHGTQGSSTSGFDNQAKQNTPKAKKSTPKRKT